MTISIGINQETRNAVLRPLVDAERDRRIAQGFTFNGKMIQAREQDKMRINGASTLAFVAMSQGAQPEDYFWHGGLDPFQWITADNSTLQLDAPGMFSMGQQAAEHESLHVFAARMLKSMEIIPEDYANDAYWPA